jgi:hypothetical protein
LTYPAQCSGVAGATRRERLVQAGAFAVGAGEAVVDVDALGRDAERLEGVALSGEVLMVGADAGVAGVQAGPARENAVWPPLIATVHRTGPTGRLGSRVALGVIARGGRRGGCVGGGPRYAMVSERDECFHVEKL